MRFLCIVEELNEDSQHRLELLQKACEKRRIEFVLLEAVSFDYTKEWEVTGTDMLYRATRGDNAIILHRFLIDDICATFYKNISYAYSRASEVEARLRQSLKNHVIKTMPTIPKDRDMLMKYVDYLGGFPIIIKALGSTHGVGIIKVDSWESLQSISDFLHTIPNQAYTLKQFISHTEQARMVVLNGEVIASHANLTLAGDFRSNTGTPSERRREVKTYPEEIQKIAIRAVQGLGLELGGVDILIDDKGNPWLSEVNFPFYFPTTQHLTGVDIAGAMVDHLMSKIG